MERFLTKSRYKLALDCPTKLYYNDNNEYTNSKLDDPFLKALANGGFQVGELAKCYFADGTEVETLNKKQALEETNELLKKENVTIFEAAITYKNLFIRVDILQKTGNKINLIEVKSVSATPSNFNDEIWKEKELKKGIYSLKQDWKSYIYDVAFQSFVLKNAFPQFQINNYLMCADKTVKASVDSLNQKFILKKDTKGRTYAEVVGSVDPKSLGSELLCKLDLNDVIEIIHSDKEMSERFEGRGFEGAIWFFAEKYSKNEKIISATGSHCKSCEFRDRESEKKCGFDECWTNEHGMNKEELAKPFIFDVWKLSKKTKDNAIKDGKHLIEDLDESDFEIDDGEASEGLSVASRQWLQVKKVKENDSNSYISIEGLQNEFSKWVYPLHMIDFETCMVAIPFHKGRTPYEQIAFQFSHHLIKKDGTIEHKDEFINSKPGSFPNFEFVRALKKALENDNGTIFRFSHHENTVLCQIMDQLSESNENDKEEIISFIKTITSKKNGKTYLWNGDRNMVDLCELVKKYYYSPKTNGSNSIKYILPAILNESEYIQKKYCWPIYNSNNFSKHTWIEFDQNGLVKDPYKSLPPIFDKYDFDFEKIELVMGDEDIQNGGAALTAYAMMQFTQMSEVERKKITEALLRYCELDTFAMVMIVEYWGDLILKKNKKIKIA